MKNYIRKLLLLFSSIIISLNNYSHSNKDIDFNDKDKNGNNFCDWNDTINARIKKINN